MKAMILAAGRGERMRPLTDTVPKPLLQVGGKMLIEYHLEKLKAANINDVVINHAWLGSEIEQALGDGSRYGLTIYYSPETEALETAGGILNALPLLKGEPDEAFIVVNGDIYCDYDFTHLPSSLSGLAHLVLVNNPVQHLQGDFVLTPSGVIEADGEHKLTYSGIGVYHPDLFNGLANGKLALAPILRKAMQQHHVSGELFTGVWHDIGTPDRLNELDLYLKNN